MANIGRLMVEISANISKLDSELNKGQNKITAFAKAAGNSLLSIAKYVGAGIAAGVASITYLIMTTTTKIADLVDEAQQFQLPVQELQKFQYAAKLAGVDAEGFGTTLQFMLKNVEEASDQMEEFAKGATPQLGDVAKAFEKLGLSASILKELNPAEQFRAIGNAFNGITSSSERVKLAMAIFGRSGVQVLNMFKDGLSQTSKEFDELGLAITDQQASAVAKWDDARTKLGALWDGFKEQATATIAPTLEAISNFIIKAIKDFGGIREVGKDAGEFVLKGLLMAIRGMESFVTSLSEGLNQIILTLETVAAAVLDASKFFITDDDKEAKIDKQLDFLNKDIEERSKPAGERAGKLFGESFASGLKSVGDIIQKEIDKIQGKGAGGASGFGSITDASGRTLATGDLSAAQKAAALEADMQKTRAIIAKYDAISRQASGGTRAIRPGEFMERFAQGVDKWGNPMFGNVSDTAIARVSPLTPESLAANLGMAGGTTRVAIDLNITTDSNGNIIANLMNGTAFENAIEGVVVNLAVGAQKAYGFVKGLFD